MKRKREDEQETQTLTVNETLTVKGTLTSVLDDALQGLLIPPLRRIVEGYTDLKPGRVKELLAIWNDYNPDGEINLDIPACDELVYLLLSLNSPTNSILPLNSSGKRVNPQTRFIKTFINLHRRVEVSKFSRREASLFALASGSRFCFRHFASGPWDNIGECLQAIFTPHFKVKGCQWSEGNTNEEAAEVFWYLADISGEWHLERKEGPQFWNTMFIELIKINQFKMARNWIEDDFTKYHSADKIKEIPRKLLQENAERVDLFHLEFPVLFEFIKSL